MKAIHQQAPIIVVPGVHTHSCFPCCAGRPGLCCAAAQRDLERRDERIRRLELQLRGAYAGIGRAVRSSKGGEGLRDSLRSESDLGDVPETQNVFDLHITDATIYVSCSEHTPPPPSPPHHTTPPAPPVQHAALPHCVWL